MSCNLSIINCTHGKCINQSCEQHSARKIELCNKRNFTCFLKCNLLISLLTNVKNNFRINKCYIEKILLCLYLTTNK